MNLSIILAVLICITALVVFVGSIYFNKNNSGKTPKDKEKNNTDIPLLLMAEIEEPVRCEIGDSSNCEENVMTAFCLEYAVKDTKSVCGEMLCPANNTMNDAGHFYEDGCIKYVYVDILNRTGISERIDIMKAEITPKYYEGLQDVVKACGLSEMHTGKIFPGGFDYDNASQYYEFYIEYDNNGRLSDFSDAPERCAEFAPIAEKILDYCKDYIKAER